MEKFQLKKLLHSKYGVGHFIKIKNVKANMRFERGVLRQKLKLAI